MKIWNEAIKAALLEIPGGCVCNPQQVADYIRRLLKPESDDKCGALKLEIELPTTLITDAAKRAWAHSLAAPEYAGRNGAEGYEAIKEQVRAHLSSAEVIAEIRESVRATAKSLADGIVREVVTDELTKLVRKITKEEKAANTLLL